MEILTEMGRVWKDSELSRDLAGGNNDTTESYTIYKSRSFSPGVDTLAKMPTLNTDMCRVYFLKYRTSHCLERLLFRHRPTYPKTKKKERETQTDRNRRHTQELRLNDSERTSVCHRWWREKNLRSDPRTRRKKRTPLCFSH